MDAHYVKIENIPWIIGVDGRGVISYTQTQYGTHGDGRRIKWNEIKEFRYRENRFTLVTKTVETIFTYTLESTTKGNFILKTP